MSDLNNLAAVKTAHFIYQSWPVSLALSTLSSHNVSGTLSVGAPGNRSSIQFCWSFSDVQRIFPLERTTHPLFHGLRLTPSRRLHALEFAYAVFEHWLAHCVSDNPSPSSTKELSPHDLPYISQLIMAGHIRLPCVKHTKKQATFLCKGTIVNPAKFQDLDLLARSRAAIEVINQHAHAFADSHHLDRGSFRDYLHQMFPAHA